MQEQYSPNAASVYEQYARADHGKGPVKGAAVLYTLLALPLGILYFTVVVTGLSLSAGLMPIFIGLPLLLGVLLTARAMLGFERSLALWVLGERQTISERAEGNRYGSGLFAKLAESLSDVRTYKGIVFLLLKLPVGIVSFTVTVTFLCVSAGFIASPVVYVVLKETLDVNIFEGNVLHYLFLNGVAPMQEALIYCAIGFILGFIALKVIRMMAELTAKITLFASE
ncbi:sensor domain-containing protein [Paenibacillus thermotolerans]|uniref:sensor domain-containing protein n=1 Tax=Paenibacillus thermotolerans TaxID=3027807 RepID=UPI002367DCBE|nr:MULTISPECIES: sensor domain-containing protein [unclassified Paenibacillus]